MEKRVHGLHAQEITDLMNAFEMNRQLNRNHFIERLDRLYKPQLIAVFHDELEYHQRNLLKLSKELLNLKYYDEELWTLMTDCMCRKQKI